MRAWGWCSDGSMGFQVGTRADGLVSPWFGVSLQRRWGFAFASNPNIPLLLWLGPLVVVVPPKFGA